MAIEKILDGLVPGIVSGLITSFITLILILNWKSFVLPFFERLVYRGVRIDKNKWKVKADGTSDNAVINFHQSAHNISGDIKWTTSDGKLIEYKIQGEFSDLILTATFKEKDTVSLDRGTITLKYLENGRRLFGGFAWYENDEIIHGPYELTKI